MILRDQRVVLSLASVVRNNRSVQVGCQNCEVPSELDGLDALPAGIPLEAVRVWLKRRGFGFLCARCGHANVLAPVVSLPQPDPPEPAAQAGPASDLAAVVPAPPGALCADADGQIACPKCQFRQDDRQACHRCGLLFANVESGRARFDTDLLASVPQAELIRARWATLADALDDTPGHVAFVELCAAHDALEFAGDRYRRLGDDPRVEPYLNKVVQLALARVPMESRALSAEGDRTRRLIVLTIAALVLLGFAYGYYLLSQHQANWQGNG